MEWILAGVALWESFGSKLPQVPRMVPGTQYVLAHEQLVLFFQFS